MKTFLSRSSALATYALQLHWVDCTHGHSDTRIRIGPGGWIGIWGPRRPPSSVPFWGMRHHLSARVDERLAARRDPACS
jgi:hypothetical protein